jgi:hypothetical protein
MMTMYVSYDDYIQMMIITYGTYITHIEDYIIVMVITYDDDYIL